MSERPRFAEGFPLIEPHAKLDELVAAFERGDYHTVREGTKALEGDDDQAVRTAAKELRSRIEPDPFAKTVLLMTLGLLVLLTFYWESHDGKRNLEPDRPPPPASAAPSPALSSSPSR